MNVNQAADILEVSTNISKEQLKIKFRKLVMKYHPDRNKSADATKKFIEIKEAYETLFKYDPSPELAPQQWINFNSPYGTITSSGNTFTFTMGSS